MHRLVRTLLHLCELQSKKHFRLLCVYVCGRLKHQDWLPGISALLKLSQDCDMADQAPIAPVEAGQAHTPENIPAAVLQDAMREALRDKDLNCISVGEMRSLLAKKFGFAPNGLECRKKELRKLTADIVQSMLCTSSQKTASFLKMLLDLKGEKDDARQQIYLVTISRVLAARLEDGRAYADLTDMERKTIGDAVREAFDHPESTAAGGRPRSRDAQLPSLISLLAVFRELHEDKSVHFHVVVKLTEFYRFGAAKRTLRQKHLLPSHFSCTHTMLWSALRYVYMGTLTKPEVDENPWVWTPGWEGFATDAGVPVDLFELSQEPYRADAWRKRREKADKEASKKKARTSFTKLDLTSVIISKHLWSKDALMAYTQDHGTAKMQDLVHSRQRKLTQDIEDAKEWLDARENAAFEAIPDWDLVCKFAEKPCPHGDNCSYHKAAEELFARNAGSVSQNVLAAALRDILIHGPKKTTRVPFLVGPSNSGKSTLMYPFDDMFTPKRVLHKPALGSSFGLRNLVGGNKRFIFWDDYRPVEFAHEKTVPVSLFLSLFIGKHAEVQASQSFNDGNPDVQWNHGVVFTGKLEGIWQPTKNVSAEDVRHMRNRVAEFPFLVPLADGSLKDVVSCASHMACWIVKGASAYDAAFGTRQPAVAAEVLRSKEAALDMDRVAAIQGLQQVLAALKVQVPVAVSLLEELERLGAVTVAELTAADWESLSAWALLLPLQRRRLLQCLEAR